MANGSSLVLAFISFTENYHKYFATILCVIVYAQDYLSGLAALYSIPINDSIMPIYVF